MKRLYKPLLIVLWLLLFGAFSSTILGQTITFNTKTDFTTGTNPLYVSIGDLNGDGKPDLAVANTGPSTVSVLLNTTSPGASTPSFSSKTDFATGSVTAIDNELVIPQKFTLEQNYSNPFNPATTIRFALPEASFVILRIYNMLGQEVKTLVNGEKNAGTYNVQWRGDNNFGRKVSSGTYIYRVIAGQNIFTKKMILLK
ncbi:MAG: T9SS type A sorting domain-containing protein [Bacteroidetes bacterium]|nr:T9SS type A sorting domain-containing protein [Bacteroidota bacterium]